VDEFLDRLARLGELDDTELSALEQDMIAAFDAADESADIELMSSVADGLDQVREELTRRGSAEEADEAPPAEVAPAPELAASAITEADAAEIVADTLEALVTGESDDESAAPSPVDEAEAITQQATEESIVPDVVSDTAQPDTETEPVTSIEGNEEDDEMANATVTSRDVPKDHTPAVTAAAPSFVINAGGDIPGITAGAPLADMDAVIDVLTRKVNAMRGVGGDGEHVIVASMRASDEVPDERLLRPGDLDGNSRKIRELLADKDLLQQEALTAAGWCAPSAPIYDVPTIGTTSRPVRDCLPSFTADRGAINWMTPPGAATAVQAMSRWVWNGSAWTAYAGPTGTAAPTVPGYVAGTKPCVEIPCGVEASAMLDALPMCLCFDNLTSRAFPEWIRANTDLTLVLQARFAEQYLLAKMFAAASFGSTVAGGVIGTPAVKFGAIRDVLVTIRLAAAQFRWRNRLAADQPMQWLAPRWLLDAMISDAMLQNPGDDSLGMSESEVRGYLGAVNITPCFYIDDVPGVAARVAAPPVLASDAVTASSNFNSYVGYPTSAEWLLYPTGSFSRLDGGSLDLGVVRTKEDVQKNKYCEFAETFESLAYMGPVGADGWVVRGTTAVQIIGGTFCCATT
jgi:hypothetical protein